eukprot:5590911-Amphidinium_carterae.3
MLQKTGHRQASELVGPNCRLSNCSRARKRVVTCASVRHKAVPNLCACWSAYVRAPALRCSKWRSGPPADWTMPS